MLENFVTACLTLSSIVPEISPPIVWASGMFIYVAAIAVDIVSYLSPTVRTISGFNSAKQFEISIIASPVLFVIINGELPSIKKFTCLSTLKLSFLIISTTDPKRSKRADPPTMI